MLASTSLRVTLAASCWLVTGRGPTGSADLGTGAVRVLGVSIVDVVEELVASWLVTGGGLTGSTTDLGTGTAGPVVSCGRVLGVSTVAEVERVAAAWLVPGSGLPGETALGIGSA